MAQITLTGKFHAAGTYFDNGSFKKQPIIVEVTENGYTSYLPVDFQKDNIQKLTQIGATIGMYYTFTCFVQGSKSVSTDKNGSPAAYLNLSCTQIAPAQAPQQATAPQAPAFNQPQQGYGAPQQPQQGFAAPAPAPAPSFAPPAQPGIGQPQGGQSFAPQQPQQAPSFAPPQQQAAPATPPQFNPNAGQQ